MTDLFECIRCGEVYHSEDAIKAHAYFNHDAMPVEDVVEGQL